MSKVVIRREDLWAVESAMREGGILRPNEKLVGFRSEGVKWSSSDPLRLALEVEIDGTQWNPQT